MIEAVRPAPMLDSVEMLRALVPSKPLFARGVTLQVAHSHTIGFVEHGRLLAVIGFWPLGDGAEEVWLAGKPAAVVGPWLVPMARLARLTLAARLHSGIGMLIGYVRIGHEPGRRLARLAGFRPVAGASPGFEMWTLEHERAGEGSLRERQLGGDAG